MLDLVPEWTLDPITAELFGSERPAGYDFDFTTTDRKLLAVEYAELAFCVRTGNAAGSERCGRSRCGCADLRALRIAGCRPARHDGGGARWRDRCVPARNRCALRAGLRNAMKLSYSTWGMQTTPIDQAVRHCAALGFDGLELTIVPGWPTDAATMSAAERTRIRRLYDDAGLELCGLSGNVALLQDDPVAEAADEARFRSYLDFAAEIQTSGRAVDRHHRLRRRPGRLGRAEARLRPNCRPIGRRMRMMPGSWWGSSRMLRTRCARRRMRSGWSSRSILPASRSTSTSAISTCRAFRWRSRSRRSRPHSLHTHVKDERGRFPDHEFLIPGEGEMDYPRYLELMSEAGMTITSWSRSA